MSSVYNSDKMVVCVYQGCSRHLNDELSFIASEHDATSPLHALRSLLQQNALEKRLHSTASLPG